MAAAPVGAEHITAFLQSNSDFAFEVSVLRTLRRAGLTCRHGGTYSDPVTGKSRQFDIYAVAPSERRRDLLQFLFAVECKNVRQHFPVVVHRLPRDLSEAYIDVIFAKHPSGRFGMLERAEKVKVAGDLSPHRVGEWVGKAFDQIGKTVDGDLLKNDQDLFEKMSQAVSASQVLLDEAYEAGAPDRPVGAFGHRSRGRRTCRDPLVGRLRR